MFHVVARATVAPCIKGGFVNDNETSSHDDASRHFRTWNSGSRLCCRYRRWLWWRIRVRFAHDHFNDNYFALDHDHFALDHDKDSLQHHRLGA
jgi:hypothetical protein